MLKMAVLDTTFVALFWCRFVTMVLPVTSVPLMRGQNLNVTVLDDVDVTCAENANKYTPPSAKVMRLAGVPCVMPELIAGASYVIAYAVSTAAAVMSASWLRKA